jgi:hypothetical protein
MLIHATSLKTWISFGHSVEKYTKFANNLVAAGCGGLEHHNGALLVERYLFGYQCKGDVTLQRGKWSHDHSLMIIPIKMVMQIKQSDH